MLKLPNSGGRYGDPKYSENADLILSSTDLGIQLGEIAVTP
jgi:hypothetical protein